MNKPSYVGFKSNEYHWKPDIDYKENPHLYKVGRGPRRKMAIWMETK